MSKKMYSIKIDPQQLTALWELREYAGQGSISGQIHRAINDYLDRQRDKIVEARKDITVSSEEYQASRSK